MSDPFEGLTEKEILDLVAKVELDTDFVSYAPKILRIVTTKGTIVPFQFNGPQLILHRMLAMIEEAQRPIRIVILKARRLGVSTYFTGRHYHKISRNRNRYASIVTHEPEATDTIFKMVKRYYDHSPPEEQPSQRYNNARLLEFNTKDGKGLNSALRVATAGKEDFGSGQLIHLCHLSELAKWPEGNTESLLTSILQCVPDELGTEVAMESTAKGIGGLFYDYFWGARYRLFVSKLDVDGQAVIVEEVNENAPEDNLYTSLFIPWFCFEEYKADSLPADFKRVTKDSKDFEKYGDEVELADTYGLADNQLYWRRLTIANKCGGSQDIFAQEYPATPTEAFLGSGRPVFDVMKVKRLMEAAPKPETRYTCQIHSQQWLVDERGGLRVWKEPKPGRHYIVSADVAEGLEKGDFSVADVIDHMTGEQVAQWHGKPTPTDFAHILNALGKRYNEAWLAVERNNHGLTTVSWLVEMRYPKIYAEMVPDPPGKPRKRYGWLTDSKTRPMIIDQIIMEMAEDSHGIVCKETFNEMLAFKVQKDGKMEADLGMHDDRVISLGIAKYVRRKLALPAPGKPSHWKEPRKTGSKGKKPNSMGWT